MLGPWRTHAQFQVWLEEQLQSLLPQQVEKVKFYADALEKMYILDLDRLKELIKPQYSSHGRPAVNQPEIFRAVVLASHFKESITSFVKRLKADEVLAIACGFEPGQTPGVGTVYDFFNRLWLGCAPGKVLRPPYKKKKKKLKANEKLPPDNPETVTELVNQVLNGESFEHEPENLLQKILAECAVKPSATLKLLGDTLKLTLAAMAPRWKPAPVPSVRRFVRVKKKGSTVVNAPAIIRIPAPTGGGTVIMNAGFTDTLCTA